MQYVKNIFIFQCQLFGLIIISHDNMRRNFSFNAGRKTDESLGIFFKCWSVDSGFVVKAFYIPL